MIENYRAHTRHPDRLTEGALGTSILDGKGLACFVIVKMGKGLCSSLFWLYTTQ